MLMSAGILMAQTLDKSEIIRSGQYYYGTGVSHDGTEARDLALEELTSQIAVQVSSSFERKLSETTAGIEENVKSVLKTHSTATLLNVQQSRSALRDGRIEVFCYLKKTEAAKIFEERKKLIADMYGNARDFAEEGNITFALRIYYFANILLNSIPEEYIQFGGVNYTLEIPNRINELIMNTRFRYVQCKQISDKEREVTLQVQHGNRPAALLDFTFWDGSNQVAVQARDGLATLILIGASINFNELKLNIKYAYYENRGEYAPVRDLWSLVQKPVFTANKNVKLTTGHAAEALPVNIQRRESQAQHFREKPHFTVEQKIEEEARKFTEFVKNPHRGAEQNPYRNDNFLSQKISNYIKHNKPKPLDERLNATLNKTNWGFEMRSIRMLHQYPSIHKQSTEYLVLDFDEDGNLRDFNLSITSNLFEKFVKQAEYGQDWGNRQVIIKFLEKYRTAYMTRDIETIDMMFAEDALIIIGREIKRQKLPDNAVQYTKLGQQPDYEYVKLKKTDYLGRQKNIFRVQQDIALDFGSFDIIKKNNVEHVYGVEMRQSYASTTYSDEGYLFLLIDFNAHDPVIYVRAWQPNSWSEEELIRTANFKIYR